MIARVWKGTARTGHADDYLAHLQHSVLPAIARIPGFVSAEVLRARDGGNDVVVITRWESMDAVRQFAGTEPNVAVVAAPAREVLASWDDHVTHYDIV